VRSIYLCILVIFSFASIQACSDASDSRPVTASDSRPVDDLITPRTDCFWLEYDKEKYNYGLNDSGATVWVAVYSLPDEGARITVEAAFPYARFMSLITYPVEGGTIDALADRDIIADNGSTNPFVEGNPRNDPSRRYLVTLASGPPPEESNSSNDNVLYGGPSGAGSVGLMVYRVYVANSGKDGSGGVGLPRVTLHMADGTTVQGEDACEILSLGVEEPPFNLPPADVYAELRGSYDPSKNPPVFRATYGSEFRVQCDFYGDCSGTPEKSSGGYNNIGTDYMYSFFNRQHGEVVVLRGKLPETPKTLDGTDSVFMEKQLRYWSVCPYEFYSTATTKCLFDEEITVNEDGFYTFVYSRESDRPNNATSECGVGYIPWSEEGDGLGIAEGRESNRDDGYLLVRNMLPAPDFTQTIVNTRVPGDEAEVLGKYLTKGKYFTKADFEGLGCNPWLAIPYDQM
jgi:hypothetical protein